MSGLPCPDCLKGSQHTGTLKGTIQTIHGLPTYVSSPAEGIVPKGIIVYIPDAFGWEFINNRILCDHYAERGGFLVYMPDFMDGHALPWSIVDLLENKIKAPLSWSATLFHKPIYIFRALKMGLPFLYFCRRKTSTERIFRFFTELRRARGAGLRIGAAGFCWGGLYTILLCGGGVGTRVKVKVGGGGERGEGAGGREGEEGGGEGGEEREVEIPLIDCGFTAHPSFVKFPDDFLGIERPLSVAIGDEDMYMKGPVILQMKELLEGMNSTDGEGSGRGTGSKRYEVVVMPGARHGFAQRTDLGDALQMGCAERAEGQALDWFRRWFA